MFYNIPIAGTGNSGIVVVDYRQRPFNVTIRAIVPSTETATYTVSTGHEDTEAQLTPTSITRVTTTATVVLPNHGLNVGDWVRVSYSGGAPLDGLYKVASITDKNTFTYTVVNSGITASGQFTVITPHRVIAIAALSAKTATLEATAVTPFRWLIMEVTAHGGGTGNLILEVIQGPSSA